MQTVDQPVPDSQLSSVARDEEAVLAFWREHDIFAKSLANRKDGPTYTFYDGPPFATGTPHYGHILVSAIKDAVPRYQTMRGKYVSRRWGWDTHGLPIENIVEKDLKISGKKEIEALGIDVFNDHARSKVLAYVHEWKKTVERIGRWVDFDGSYKTMDNDYIESVWWALGQLRERGLVYEGTRVLPYCPRCETPIANSEIAMDNSYRDITDLSVYVTFELADEPGTYFVAWTTTPWTLPGNTGLALNAKAVYLKVKAMDQQNRENIYIFAQDRLAHLARFFTHYEILSEIRGRALAGLRYRPLFPYYLDRDLPDKERIYQTHLADYVTLEDGTGIVHLAPAFGEIDMELAKTEHFPVIWHVNPDGRFKPEVTDFAGLPVKPKDDHQRTDIEIIKYLAGHDLLLAKEKILHSYPHCFRCETPLFYYAIPAWFVKVSDIKPRLLALNEDIEWVPNHLKHGRFRKSMEGAPDWNISRNRYWASPLPIWRCDRCKAIKFVTSVAELANFARQRNQFILLRHDQATSNVARTVAGPGADARLTPAGEYDAARVATQLKGRNITHIYASPSTRTRETAAIIARALAVPVIVDDRLREIGFGDLDGASLAEYRAAYPDIESRFIRRPPGGENLTDVLARMRDFAQSINAHHRNQTILVVSHGDPLWLLAAATQQQANPAAIEQVAYPQLAEPIELRYPEIDLHRPWIDEVTFACQCGGTLRRIPEVFDCWFESGSMPFAPEHVPFEHNDWFAKHFPADFVSEYLAQTRTWFYYMHLLAGSLFDQVPFRHVVTTGNVLAEDGQKMSKSKQNFPDPWLMFDRYGVDAVRFYLLASPLLRAEDVNFSERGLDEVFKKIILRLKNTLAFYELYPDTQEVLLPPQPAHVLDRWIMTRLQQTIGEVTAAMDAYLIADALRPIETIIDDLSVWYVRRSRDRFKVGDDSDRRAASHSLRWVLAELAKIIAPFTPFLAEELYQRTAANGGKESVHLEDWPTAQAVDRELLEAMARARQIVSLGLEARKRAGLKVRQPLAGMQVAGSPTVDRELEAIISDELNIKTLAFATGQALSVELDTRLTPELIREGHRREVIRHIQSLRKQHQLAVGAPAIVSWSTSASELKEMLTDLADSDSLPATRLVAALESTEGTEFPVGDQTIVLQLKAA